MSSVEKGDNFEYRTYNILNGIIKNQDLKIILQKEGELWIVPKHFSVNQKVKKQFPWGDSVINDLTIEGQYQDKDFLILVECKDYNSPVDRGDIAEFNTRIEDLRANKGIFITTNRFQSGAINMARYHNIALVRVNPDNMLVWDLHRIGDVFKSYQDTVNCMCADRIQSSTIVLDKYSTYTSLTDYMCSILSITPEPINKCLPYLSEEYILNQVSLFLNNRPYNFVDEKILLFYLVKNGISYDLDADCGPYLGEYDFLNRKVRISTSLNASISRQRFTLAHEIGHAVLHRQLDRYIAKAIDYNLDCITGCSKWQLRLELQANLFASYLLMPYNAFINFVMELKLSYGIPLERPFFLDNQMCNIEICHDAISKIAKHFNVSFIAAKKRMIHDKLLVEKTIFNYEKI